MPQELVREKEETREYMRLVELLELNLPSKDACIDRSINLLSVFERLERLIRSFRARELCAPSIKDSSRTRLTVIH